MRNILRRRSVQLNFYCYFIRLLPVKLHKIKYRSFAGPEFTKIRRLELPKGAGACSGHDVIRETQECRTSVRSASKLERTLLFCLYQLQKGRYSLHCEHRPFFAYQALILVQIWCKPLALLAQKSAISRVCGYCLVHITQ